MRSDYIWAACVQSFDWYWSVDVLYRLLISNKKALNNSAVITGLFLHVWEKSVWRLALFSCFLHPKVNLNFSILLSWSLILVHRCLLTFVCWYSAFVAVLSVFSMVYALIYVMVAKFIKFKMDPNKDSDCFIILPMDLMGGL